ncbi:MAG: RagB/SusD family nutrient uptake outer membrane protein [Adhaeribacter sp.]
MKRIITLGALAGSLLLSAGCESMLEVAPQSQITSANYWKAEGDVLGYMTGIYSDFRGLMNTTYYLEDRGDSFVPGLEGPPTTAWEQNLNPNNAPNWVNFYNLIHHTNLLLKYAPGITFSSPAKQNRVLAEAYFIRAHVYFSLTRAWGDVPLVLQPTESDVPLLPERAPAAAVMDQVLSDVNKAISLFPEEGFINKSLASKPAAYALKADALLWKKKVLQGSDQDLEDAIAAIDGASPGLSLVNLAQVHDPGQRNNAEIIFSLRFLRDERSDQYGSRLKPRDLFVASAANKTALPYAKNGARSVYAPSPKIEGLYNQAGEKRKGEFIIKALDAGNQVIGTFDNKFKGTAHPDDRYFDNDIVIYRLADLLLLKAEALAALGRLPLAVAELNKVRNRAGTGDYTGAMNKQAVEKEILDERFRELYLELKRWPDLLRFHFGGTINVYQEVPNLQGSQVPLFFPIPRAQIDINPNLKQTEGY